MDLQLPRPSNSYTVLDKLEVMRIHTVEVSWYVYKQVKISLQRRTDQTGFLSSILSDLHVHRIGSEENDLCRSFYRMYSYCQAKLPGGGEGTPKKLGEGVQTTSQNPYPIYD